MPCSFVVSYILTLYVCRLMLWAVTVIIAVRVHLTYQRKTAKAVLAASAWELLINVNHQLFTELKYQCKFLMTTMASALLTSRFI